MDNSHQSQDVHSSVTIVSSTRLDESLFWRATYLGRSLTHIPPELRPRLAIHYRNLGTHGLPEIYNRALQRASDDDTLILVHDDVYLHDWFIAQRALAAIASYDVAGVAGSVNPDLQQPSWGLAFNADMIETGWQPSLQRSGAVNHFDYVNPGLSVYGPTPQDCLLLDGVLLVVNVGKLRAAGICFDEEFQFHLYDLDFCRSATQAGLRLGTWPIAITHNSGGGYDTAAFRDAALRYLAKWQAPA